MRWLVALLLVVVGGVATVVWTRVDRCDGVNVNVFLDPDVSDERRSAVRAEIEDIESDIVYVDQAEAYEEFSELFRNEPDMVRSVNPEQLPPSYRFTLDDEPAPAVSERLRALPGVSEIAVGPCDDTLGRRRVPMPSPYRSSRSSSMMRTGSAPTGTTLSVVTPASR